MTASSRYTRAIASRSWNAEAATEGTSCTGEA